MAKQKQNTANHSPTINFRLSHELLDRVKVLAEQEERLVSDIARHALELYCRAKDQTTKGDSDA